MKKTLLLGALISLPLLGTSALAYESGDWVLRAGAATVDPDADSDLGLDVNSNTQLGITGSYLVTDRVGVGLLAATPFTHDVSLGGTDIAEVTHLPPTLTAQYFFNAPASPLQVYAGVGVNYTITLDEKLTGAGKSAGLRNLDVDNSLGFAGELGVDYAFNAHWLLNAAVWYLDLELEVSANGGAVKDDLDISPWVYMVGIGYRF